MTSNHFLGLSLSISGYFRLSQAIYIHLGLIPAISCYPLLFLAISGQFLLSQHIYVLSCAFSGYLGLSPTASGYQGMLKIEISKLTKFCSKNICLIFFLFPLRFGHQRKPRPFIYVKIFLSQSQIHFWNNNGSRINLNQS